MPEVPVGRCVYHLGGFDPMTPEATVRRFEREMARFEATWSLHAQTGPLSTATDDAVWTVDASGPDWQVRSEHHLMRWDDVIMAARERPQWSRVPLGLAALLDFIRHGALWSYLRRSTRYAGFFLYPLLVLLAMAGVSLALGIGAARLSGFAAAGIAAGLIGFAALIVTLGQALYLDHLLDDWIFARDVVYRDHPVLGPRLDRVAKLIVARQASDPETEVVIVGHSLGAVLAVDLVDRILALDPNGAAIRLVTIGSSILKIGFHRKSLRLRGALARLAAHPRVIWVEYQALSDVMNFYKRNPVAELGIAGHGPSVRTVRFSRMLDPAAYAKIKRNLFRLHCQFISGNTKRDAYDYFLLICGPFRLEDLAASPEGAMTWITPDGHLAPDAPTPRLTESLKP